MYDLSKWTGKTPITLLHELCQKKKWLKPQYFTVCTFVVENIRLVYGVAFQLFGLKVADPRSITVVKPLRSWPNLVMKAVQWCSLDASFRLTEPEQRRVDGALLHRAQGQERRGMDSARSTALVFRRTLAHILSEKTPGSTTDDRGGLSCSTGYVA
jgi:hypothetical protein